jgi:hypothetical protein
MKPSRRPPSSSTTALSDSPSRRRRRTSAAPVSGVTDARRDGVLFGEGRLQEAVRANLPLDAQTLADTLLETAREYAGGVLADDCAVVAVKLP